MKVSVAESCATARSLSTPAGARLAACAHGLSNAFAAAAGSPIRVEVGGHDDRLRIEIKVERPPRQGVVSRRLTGDHFGAGSWGPKAERLGLDLGDRRRASSELLGGVRRTSGGRTAGQWAASIVLDWPRTARPRTARVGTITMSTPPQSASGARFECGRTAAREGRGHGHGRRAIENEIFTRASAVAFYAMLACVPFLGLLLTVLVQLLLDPTCGHVGTAGKKVGDCRTSHRCKDLEPDPPGNVSQGSVSGG